MKIKNKTLICSLVALLGFFISSYSFASFGTGSTQTGSIDYGTGSYTGTGMNMGSGSYTGTGYYDKKYSESNKIYNNKVTIIKSIKKQLDSYLNSFGIILKISNDSRLTPDQKDAINDKFRSLHANLTVIQSDLLKITDSLDYK